MKPTAKPAAKPARPASEKAKEQSNLRLFYAIKVPSAIASELAQAQSKLRGNWRKVEANGLHITLAYLPKVPSQQVLELKRLGVQVAHSSPPLSISLRGTGYFPNEGSPRVWFVKAEAEGLEAMAQALGEGISALGLETDESSQKTFKAHITLARKKGPAPRLPPMLFDGLAWQASQMSLIQSTLRKTGPIYQTLSRFEFKGADHE